MTAKDVVGSPWRLLNLSDVIIIGLIAILSFQVMSIFGMGFHRWMLWRRTGSMAGVINTNPQGSF